MENSKKNLNIRVIIISVLVGLFILSYLNEAGVTGYSSFSIMPVAESNDSSVELSVPVVAEAPEPEVIESAPEEVVQQTPEKRFEIMNAPPGTFTDTSTADFDAGNKTDNSDGNYLTETNTDNLNISTGEFQLANKFSDRFTLDDADGFTWKWLSITDIGTNTHKIEDGKMQVSTARVGGANGYMAMAVTFNISGDYDAQAKLDTYFGGTSSTYIKLRGVINATNYISVYNKIDGGGRDILSDTDINGVNDWDAWSGTDEHISLRVKRNDTTTVRGYYDLAQGESWTLLHKREGFLAGDAQIRLSQYSSLGDGSTGTANWTEFKINNFTNAVGTTHRTTGNFTSQAHNTSGNVSITEFRFNSSIPKATDNISKIELYGSYTNDSSTANLVDTFYNSTDFTITAGESKTVHTISNGNIANDGYQYWWYRFVLGSVGNSSPIIYDIEMDYSAAPANLSLLSPANGASISDTTPTFDWLDATDPDGDPLTYDLIVGVNSSFYGTDYGDGSDGSLTITAVNTVVNNYTSITTAALSAGDAAIGVSDASEFSPGDEILIIQMQNDSSSVAGTYEFNHIRSISGSTITLYSGLTNSYVSGTFDAANADAAQIVKVPNYINVVVNAGTSITADAWNGSEGGILIFRAYNISGSGEINATAKGFRGVISIVGDNHEGNQGESYTGTGASSRSANDGAGGGGGYNTAGTQGHGGGGGGYGTTGVDGDYNSGYAYPAQGSGPGGTGGSVYAVANMSRFFIGSAGGSGGTDQDDVDHYGGKGGDGGGAIIIFAQNINVSNITSRGETGGIGFAGSGGLSEPGGGGGGAGGAIFISTDSLNSTIRAEGGAGGDRPDPAGNFGYDGGSGGNGSIRLDYSTYSGSEVPSSTYNGTFERLISKVNISSSIYSLPSLGALSLGLYYWKVRAVDNDSAAGSWSSVWNFNLLANVAPTHNDPLLNSSSGTNTTNENITCYNQSTSDPNGDSVTNIYNWYRNDTPIIVLNMPFDTNFSQNGTAGIKDYSGYGNDGTPYNFSWGNTGNWTPNGKIGGAYEFDGVDDYIDVGTPANLRATQTTYSAWIKHDAVSIPAANGAYIVWGAGVFTAVKHGVRFHLIGTGVDGGKLIGIIGTGDATEAQAIGGSPLNDSTWHHTAITWDANELLIYVDGVEVASDSSESGDIVYHSDNYYFSIGALDLGTSQIRFFNGTIDEVRIYNRSLSAAQIYQLYQDTKDGFSSSQTIVSDETTTGENWTCSITPNDATEDGTAKNSSTMVILAPATPWYISGNVSGLETCTDEEITATTNITIYAGGELRTNNCNLTISPNNLNIAAEGLLNVTDSILIVNNWQTNGTTIVDPSTIWLNGDLEINNNTIWNETTVRVNGTVDGEYNININAGGNLTIVQNSNITNGEDPTANYRFRVYSGAGFDARDSTIEKVGWQTGAIPYQDQGIWIGAANISMLNITINTDYGGIVFSQSEHNLVENCTINNLTSATVYGIYMRYTNYSNFTNNRIYVGDDYGIRMVLSSRNNRINSNYIEVADDYGIYLAASPNNISYNTINLTGADSIYGILLESSSNGNTVSGNNITAEDQVIRLNANSYNNTIHSNRITARDDYGIYLLTSINNTVSSNIINMGDDSGIYLLNNADYNNITSNNVTGGSNLVYLFNSHNNNIDLNNITSSGSYSVRFLISSENNILSSNEIIGSNYVVTIDNNARNNTVRMNNITSTNDNGIYISGTNNNTIISNNITVADDTGIYISGGASNNLINLNRITQLGASSVRGIYLYTGAAFNNITHNNITITSQGIYLHTWPANNTISYNTITAGNTGIYVGHNATNNALISNNISITGNTGLSFVYDAHNNTAISNNITVGGNNAVYSHRAQNNVVINSTLTSGAGQSDFELSTYGSLTSINNSFNKSKVAFQWPSTATLFVKWYYNTYVHNSTGDLDNANVSLYNTSGILEDSQLTSATGYTLTRIIQEYMQNITAYYNDTPHNITGTKAGYCTNISSVGILSSMTYNMSITRDTFAPAVNINSPSQGDNVTGAILINATLTDCSQVNESSVYYWLSNSSGNQTAWISMSNLSSSLFNATFDTTIIADGYYNVSINATDINENENSTETVQIRVDNTAPQVIINAPIGVVSGSVIINATIIDSITGVNSSKGYYWLSNATGNQTPWISMSNTTASLFNATFDTTLFVDGNYNITINASDNIDNENSTETVQIIIDNSVPDVSINSPASGANISTPLIINATITDGVGVNASKAYYWISNSSGNQTAWTPMSNTSATSFNATFTTIGLADGYYNVTINASDILNNENSSEKSQFRVDNTAPTVTAGDTSGSGTSIIFTYTVADVSEVTSCELIIDNSVDQTSTAITKGTSQTFTSTLSEGAHTWSVNCTDSLNNEGSSAEGSFTISTSSGSSGGGGSSSSAISKFAPADAAIKAEVIQTIRTLFDEPVTIAISDPDIAVNAISIVTKETASDAIITVRSLSERPGAVLMAPPGVVYQYLSISASNLDSANIKEGAIQFGVLHSWIAEESIAVESIKLYRYVGDNWEPLTTKTLSETDIMAAFSAETSGFSYFAIAGQARLDAAAGEVRSRELFFTDQRIPTNMLSVSLFVILILVIAGIVIYERYKHKLKLKKPTAENNQKSPSAKE